MRSGWAFVVGGTLLAGVRPAWGDGPRLDPAAVEAWRRYEAVSGFVQGVATKSTRSAVKPNDPPKVYPTQYRQSATGGLIVSTLGKKDIESCLMRNPRYVAEVRRRPGGGNELIQLIDRDPNTVLPSAKTPLANALFTATGPHFCYQSHRLTELISDPRFKLVNVGPSASSGLVRIEYTSELAVPGPNSEVSRRKGWMDLSPALGWSVQAIKESEEYFKNGGRDHTLDWDVRFVVTNDSDGVPLVRKRTTTTTGHSNQTGKKLGAVIETDYDLRVDRGIPDREFTLTAFNLPEPWEEPACTPVAVWIGLAAVVFGLAAVLFRRLARPVGGTK